MYHIEKCSFRFVTLEDVRLIIKDLKNNKAAGGDIRLKLLKECDFTYDILYIQYTGMWYFTTYQYIAHIL